MICTLSIHLNILHSANWKNDCPDICQDCHYRQLSSSNWKHCMLKLVLFSYCLILSKTGLTKAVSLTSKKTPCYSQISNRPGFSLVLDCSVTVFHTTSLLETSVCHVNKAIYKVAVKLHFSNKDCSIEKADKKDTSCLSEESVKHFKKLEGNADLDNTHNF